MRPRRIASPLVALDNLIRASYPHALASSQHPTRRRSPRLRHSPTGSTMGERSHGTSVAEAAPPLRRSPRLHRLLTPPPPYEYNPRIVVPDEEGFAWPITQDEAETAVFGPTQHPDPLHPLYRRRRPRLNVRLPSPASTSEASCSTHHTSTSSSISSSSTYMIPTSEEKRMLARRLGHFLDLPVDLETGDHLLPSHIRICQEEDRPLNVTHPRIFPYASHWSNVADTEDVMEWLERPITRHRVKRLRELNEHCLPLYIDCPPQPF